MIGHITRIYYVCPVFRELHYFSLSVCYPFEESWLSASSSDLKPDSCSSFNSFQILCAQYRIFTSPLTDIMSSHDLPAVFSGQWLSFPHISWFSEIFFLCEECSPPSVPFSPCTRVPLSLFASPLANITNISFLPSQILAITFKPEALKTFLS